MRVRELVSWRLCPLRERGVIGHDGGIGKADAAATGTSRGRCGYTKEKEEKEEKGHP